MKDFLKKLTSRKFIATAITTITGIITMFIGDNEIVQIISGAAMTIVPVIVYCIMEGVVDAASVKTITDATVDAAEKLGADEKTVEIIENIGDMSEVILDENNPNE